MRRGSQEWIERYGFGITTLSFPMDMVGPDGVGYDEQWRTRRPPDAHNDRNTAFYERLDAAGQQAYEEALSGLDGAGGCQGVAFEALPDPVRSAQQGFEQALDDLDVRIRSSPEYRDLTGRVDHCMSIDDFEFTGYDDLEGTIVAKLWSSGIVDYRRVAEPYRREFLAANGDRLSLPVDDQDGGPYPVAGRCHLGLRSRGQELACSSGPESERSAMPITVSAHGSHVAVVTIDNPSKANAMSRHMLAELAGIWPRLDGDPACRVIVVTGAGDRAFSAGADVSGDLSADEETAATINRALLKTEPIAKPVIAAVNGACLGGGVELLLASDIRYAAPNAVFGLPEVKWAIYPFGGAAAKLVHQIGYAPAMKLLLTAENIDAHEAVRIGLINEVVPIEQLMERAIATAEMVAGNSPMAVQAVKRFVSTGLAERTKAREPFEQAIGDEVRASADFAEGVAAFRERRQPTYE